MTKPTTIHDPMERQRLERILADVDRRLVDTPLPPETRRHMQALSRRLRRQLSPGWMPADLGRRIATVACRLLSLRAWNGVTQWPRPHR